VILRRTKEYTESLASGLTQVDVDILQQKMRLYGIYVKYVYMQCIISMIE